MSVYEISRIANQLIRKALNSNPSQTQRAFLNKFMNVQFDLEKVNFVYNLLGSHDLFPRFVPDGKNDEIAKVYKEDGNEMFASGLYLEALKIYTCSISTAESKDVLALVYANRSACLLKLELFQEGLTDIQRALENGYPQNLMPKLLSRKKAALKSLRLATVTPWHEEIPTIPESRRNKLIQCAKDCVEIRSSEQGRRHIVATCDIEIGEVIAVENPFTHVAANEKLLHCHECLQLCYNLIPCPNCTRVLYCNKSCKEKAFNEYHKHECAALVTFIDFLNFKGVELLAVKTTLLSLDQEILQNEEDLVYRSDRYKEIHYLKRCTEDLEPLALFHNAVLTAVVFKILKDKSSLFQSNQAFEKKFKEVLYIQLQVCSLHNMAIQEFFPPSPRGSSDFGQGLYAFGSLFNHSCCPNVQRFCYGSAVVYRTNCTIKKGEQCLMSYGPNYRESSKLERQQLLSRFFFTCTCEACRHNWKMVLFGDYSLMCFGLKFDPLDFLDKLKKMREGDIHVAKGVLSKIMPPLRKWEPRACKHSIEVMKSVIFCCYIVFGNKRKI